MGNFDELHAFFVEATGLPEADWKPLQLSPDDVAEALWPMNDVLRPKKSRLETLAYSGRFEAEADQAVVAFSRSGEEAFAGMTSGAWRVLAERHLQMLTVCTANVAAGEKVMSIIPAQLPEALRTRAAVLEWWLRMKLPFPPHEKGALRLPPEAMPGPMRRQ